MQTKILVVDDEPGIRDLLHEVLVDDGHEVVEAANGQEGLKAFFASRPDLVVLDATGRVDEIARMLGGASLTDTTRRHADEMLAAGRAQSAPEPSARKSRRVAQ